VKVKKGVRVKRASMSLLSRQIGAKIIGQLEMSGLEMLVQLRRKAF